jgi:hypothetical protein
MAMILGGCHALKDTLRLSDDHPAVRLVEALQRVALAQGLPPDDVMVDAAAFQRFVEWCDEIVQ